MSLFSFFSNGKTFNVKGPANLTLDQARAIFDKQNESGGLAGLKPGNILSSASQAAAGLKSAIASVGQTISGITGALGSGISSAAGQIGSLVQGGNVSSFATNAVGKIKSIVGSGVPSNPIGIADYAKQATALTGIAGMNVPQTTGVLAQAKNLVGQAPDVLTNSKGLGSFGLDASQLERAGYLKPGTSKLLAAGASTLSSVLKSPAVFTGKDGITTVNSLLSNEGAQSKIQQSLMASGTAGLEQLGVPVASLPANLSAGLSLSAAKSLPDTERLIKGADLPSDVKTELNTDIVDGAYASTFSEDKVDDAFKEEEAPVAAVDTTNRETLDAATLRILGSDKIPVPDYTFNE